MMQLSDHVVLVWSVVLLFVGKEPAHSTSDGDTKPHRTRFPRESESGGRDSGDNEVATDVRQSSSEHTQTDQEKT